MIQHRIRTENWHYPEVICLTFIIQQPHHLIKSIVIISAKIIAINSCQLLELSLGLFTHFLNFIRAFSRVQEFIFLLNKDENGIYKIARTYKQVYLLLILIRKVNLNLSQKSGRTLRSKASLLTTTLTI